MRKSSGLLVLFLSVLLFVAAFLTVTTEEAGAQPMLLGTTGMGGTASTLVELNAATGALIRTIGPIGYSVNGLVYDHTTERLFASTSVEDPSHNGLIEIDLNTGAGTPVGVAGWGLGDTAAVTNITVNAAGQMYGWWDPSQDDLVIIDKTTGIATRVGESGEGTAQNGLDFDSSGILYMVNSGGDYFTVNTTTGAATSVNSIGDTAHHGKFNPDSDIWYGIDATGTGSKNLVLADLSTSTITDTIPTVDNLHTIEFVSTTAVPGSGRGGIWTPPPAPCGVPGNTSGCED